MAKTKIEVEKLPRWRAIYSKGDGWCVFHEGKVLFTNLTEEAAKIIAAAPQILRFLSLFQLRENVPAGIDVARLLDLAEISLER